MLDLMSGGRSDVDAVRLVAVRGLRAAPSMRLGVVATAAGTTPKTLRRDLARLRRRGVCDEAAARLFASGGVDARGAVLDRALTPPPIVRRAALDRSGAVSGRGVGTAAWAAPYRRGPAPRCVEAAQARYADTNQVGELRPAAMLARLASHPSAQIRDRTLRNANCPRWLLEMIAASGDPDDCRSIAASSVTGPRLLERLTGRRFEPARMIIPSGYEDSSWVRERLAEQANVSVASTAAANPAADPRLVERLAARPEIEVGVALAATTNPACTPELLQRLAGHTNAEVRSQALGHSSYPVQTITRLEGLDHGELCALGRNPSSPADLLERMGEHHDDDVRCAVARNVNCPQQLLARLGSDEAATVRLLVSRHDRCPPELKEQIGTDIARHRPRDLGSVIDMAGELYDTRRNRPLGG